MVMPFEELIQIMSTLRNPDKGCPWDLEQTHSSLKGSLLEEVYELLDALDAKEKEGIIEELGDLLLQVVFHAQIGKDSGVFDIDQVIRKLNEKLVRRHPHVFGEQPVGTASEVLGQWEELKAKERKAKGEQNKSMLSGVSTAMPALAYAYSVIGRARRAGFQWDKIEDAFQKVSEEIEEFEKAESSVREIEEFGDILLALVGVAHEKNIDPELALRSANSRFFSRFSSIEVYAREKNIKFTELTSEQKLVLWEQAKDFEKQVK